MKIFLSYASEFSDIAESLSITLSAKGHDVFFDRFSLPPTEDYNSHIRKAIRESDLFIFLISPESVADGAYTLSELGMAQAKWAHPKNHVLPVMAHPTNLEDVPVYLRSVSILEPRGHIIAEVSAAVEPLPRDMRSITIINYARKSWEKLRSFFQSEPESVHIGVSAPQTVKPGKEFTARFVAYIPAMEKEVEAQLAKLSPASETYMQLRACRWQPNTQVTVRLYGEHIVVPEPEQTFKWNGKKNQLDYDVKVPHHAPESTTILKFDVSIAGIIIAKIRIDLEIDPNAVSTKANLKRTTPARTAFASYASNDRLRVLDRVSEVQRNGVDVFLDCLSLNPGEKWKPRLKKEIKRRELFLLFWSKIAKESQWVDWEWRTCYGEKGIDGIDPHPLDPVFEAEPPEELKSLHFEDRFMLLRKAYHSLPASKTSKK